MRTLDDAPLIDTMSPEMRADPHAVFDQARQESWVVRSTLGGLVIDREHVQALLADRRLRGALVDFIEIQGVTSGVLHKRMTATLLAIDGPDHTRVRAIVRKAFVPSAIERHRPLMRSILESLVRPLRGLDRCDFVAAVAEHYPIQVMCHLLGVPVDDHERFTTWIKAIGWTLSFQLAEHFDEAEAGARQMDDYIAALIADRRRQPRDDLVTELVQAEEAGDRLSDDELRSLILGLLFAGYDTTRNQLSMGLLAFADHPDQWALLSERPELAPQAVEEMMRFRGSVEVAPRVVAETFELDGYRFEEGTFLFLATSAANHDPAAYERPHDFDITARREPQLTFGGGPHYCLGAHLARAELGEAIPILTGVFPGLTLDGEPVWRPAMGIVGPDTLPIRYDHGS